MDNKKLSHETIGLLVHAYNNYLSGLMGFTELALMECEQPEVKQRLDLAMDSGNEAVVFGKELLSSIGRLQVAFKPLIVADLINQLTNQNNNFVINQNSYQQSELSSSELFSDLKIETDKRWLSYCFAEIESFYLNFAQQAKINLQFEISDSWLEIHFNADFKLNQSQQSKLFEAFYTTRTMLGKKGVGLAFVAGFVQQMKGLIEWHSNQGLIIKLKLSNLKKDTKHK